MSVVMKQFEYLYRVYVPVSGHCDSGLIDNACGKVLKEQNAVIHDRQSIFEDTYRGTSLAPNIVQPIPGTILIPATKTTTERRANWQWKGLPPVSSRFPLYGSC